jgi:hypothetical protein
MQHLIGFSDDDSEAANKGRDLRKAAEMADFESRFSGARHKIRGPVARFFEV